MTSRIPFACGFILLFGAVNGAWGAPIIFSAAGLPAPDVVITFDEVVLPDGTPLTNQYAGLGVSFANAFYNTPPAPPGASPHIVAPYVVNFGVDLLIHEPLSILFSTPQRSAAFALVSNPSRGPTIFEALLGGTSVEFFAARTNFTNPDNFFGFTRIDFDEIRIFAPANGAVAIDNLQIGPAPATIPEPGSLALAAAGIAGLLISRRRRPGGPRRDV